MPDSVVRQPDGQATFESFCNGVPPERFIAVFSGFHQGRTVSVALMPENSLQEDSHNLVIPGERQFTLHSARAIHIENFGFDDRRRRADAIRAYMGLIARGIPGRLATTIEFTQRQDLGHRDLTWKLKEGNLELQSALTGEVVVPGPAAVAPSFAGIVIVESAVQIQIGQVVLVTHAGTCIPVAGDSGGPEIGRVISQSRSASRASYLTHVQMVPAEEARHPIMTVQTVAADPVDRQVDDLLDERELLEERIRELEAVREYTLGRIQELARQVADLRHTNDRLQQRVIELEPAHTVVNEEEEPDQQEPTPEEVEAEHARLRQEFMANQMNPPELRGDPDPRLTEADFDRICNEELAADQHNQTDMPF